MQTLSATTVFRKRPRPLTRCKGSKDEQATVSPPGVIANGFLKHRFLPIYETTAGLPEKEKVETVYLKAVKNLAAHYKIDAIDVRNYPYPYNVLLSNWDISRQIKHKSYYREIQIAETDKKNIEVSVRESVNTGSSLFYIPLVPLFKALHIGGHSCAPLLLSVCAYLFQKVGVCHYKDDESYMCYLYETMDNWIEDDRETMDKEDYTEQRAILDEISFTGDQMKGFLSDKNELTQLQNRIKTFIPADQLGRASLKLAKETLALWVEFPAANIYQHLAIDEGDEEDDYYGDGKIKVNDYISFVGEMKSCVYESMMNMLNDDFNERSGVQDFETTIVFNGRRKPYKDILVYEERVLRIIEDLIDLINELT